MLVIRVVLTRVTRHHVPKQLKYYSNILLGILLRVLRLQVERQDGCGPSHGQEAREGLGYLPSVQQGQCILLPN